VALSGGPTKDACLVRGHGLGLGLGVGVGVGVGGGAVAVTVAVFVHRQLWLVIQCTRANRSQY